jgi:hypothetical protein
MLNKQLSSRELTQCGRVEAIRRTPTQLTRELLEPDYAVRLTEETGSELPHNVKLVRH